MAEVLSEMSRDPFAGDTQPLKEHATGFRRRVGNWRILFDVYPETRTVDVVEIERRTSTIYKRQR